MKKVHYMKNPSNHPVVVAAVAVRSFINIPATVFSDEMIDTPLELVMKIEKEELVVPPGHSLKLSVVKTKR